MSAEIAKKREELEQVKELARSLLRQPGGSTSPAYRAASRKMSELATEIAAMETEQHRKDDPLESMTIDELRSHYEAKEKEYGAMSGRDFRTITELTRIADRIRQKEEENESNG
ncbi:hypothetical protein [Paenibacillus sp.]|uniref:hypothetical protein n=1 Tax=Paenibacillus sp. TaxID=58172 RepID=UPI002D2F496E|nr:hypothetical protein [Paenibacillus sp.]HZG87303.1 hypothetical protein [Paenibacillus sp.]